MLGPSKRTISKRDAETLAQYQEDKEKASETARSAYRSEQQAEDTFNTIAGNKPKSRLLGANRNAERSKYLYNDDSDDDEDEKQKRREDEADEDQINDDLDDLTDMVGRLKGAAMGMGSTLETQNQRLDRLAGKVSSLNSDLDHLVHPLT